MEVEQSVKLRVSRAPHVHFLQKAQQSVVLYRPSPGPAVEGKTLGDLFPLTLLIKDVDFVATARARNHECKRRPKVPQRDVEFGSQGDETIQQRQLLQHLRTSSRIR